MVAGVAVYVAFLWDRLSFIPETIAYGEFAAGAGILAGLLGDQLVQRRIRVHARQLVIAIGSLAASVAVFILHNTYVVWATKAGYVEGLAADFQYVTLFVTAFLWTLPWASAGRFLTGRSKAGRSVMRSP